MLRKREGYRSFYKTREGRYHEFYCRRYTIPWFFGDKLIGIQRRLDSEQALKIIEATDPAILRAIREDIGIGSKGRKNRKPLTPEEITDRDLIQWLFWDKYKKVEGSRGAIFNVNRLLQLGECGQVLYENNLPVLQYLDYVLVTEGEIDALSAESAGFYAVSATVKGTVDYEYLFSRVYMPLIVADNDGGTGMSKALAMLDTMAHPGARIIVPPAPFKDLNDMFVAGVAQKWLASNIALYPPNISRTTSFNPGITSPTSITSSKP